MQARAAIEGWLAELSDEQQRAIALHHSPEPWPDDLEGHDGDSVALAAEQRLPSEPVDLLYSAEVLAWRARRRVSIAHEREGKAGLRRLVRRSRWLYEDAVRAYAAARGRVASVVPVESSAFRAVACEEEVTPWA
jgi:hypothetical protein